VRQGVTEMTERQAETIANIVLGVAAASAAYYVLTNAEARRAAWRAARTALAASGPWLIAEARQGWAASAGRSDAPADDPVRQTRAV
jgi:hypothetical protein